MKGCGRGISLLCYYLKINVKKLVIYKADFTFNVFATFLWIGSGLFNILILFSRINTLKGWNFAEMAMLYGMWSLTFAIYNIFGNGILEIENHIVKGSMDLILTKPISPLFQIVFSRISPSGVAFLLFGVIFTVLSSIKVNIKWTIGKILYLILSSIIGGALIFATYLILASLAFWYLKSTSAVKIGYDIHKFAQYPITIYSKYITLLLLTIFPYAFTNYFPIAFILGKVPWFYGCLSPGVGVIVILLSGLIWRKGLRNYESSGS